MECPFYGNGKFVAAGINGQVYTSSDGINWYSASNPLGNGVYEAPDTVCYGNGMFVAVTPKRGIVYSYDGINWNIAKNNSSSSSYSVDMITYGDGKFVYVSKNSIYYSQVRI